jgi:branched-chain amino acid transport system ATP-binding protein|tara:strand:+ start:784 stop:2349 length:1566 start_codon:yes stop_codon:yes gene_type:complete
MSLVVNDISMNFGGLQALQDVAFRVDEGEMVALIGPNGAGKSTLINIICGSYPPSCGSVEFKGSTISGVPPHRLNQTGIARTFQTLELFKELTVKENVIAGGVAHADVGVTSSLLRSPRVARARETLSRKADEYLELVGLAARRDVPAAILSAGQQRLLTIARVLASGADWLFLDEPGAGLNPVAKENLAEVVLRLKEHGKTIFFVEHDMGFVGRLAERIIVVDRGKAIADGLPEAVRSDEKVISAYLGVQVASAQSNCRSKKVVATEKTEPLLDIRNLTVRFGGITALDGLNVKLMPGELVAVVGANGAGKSTLLKSIVGEAPATEGSLILDGQEITNWTPRQVVTAGVSMCPEGRQLFSSMSVLDNMKLGRYTQIGTLERWVPERLRSKKSEHESERLIEEIFEIFPMLRARQDQLAGTLSGGEGQILSVGRALMNTPKVLVLDEPSLGVAPQMIAEIFKELLALQERGLTILLVEQNARAALEIADRGYVLDSGSVVAEAPARELLESESMAAAYLGR